MRREVTYLLAMHEAERGGYTCSFPDFECLVDEGDTLAEAVLNARELLRFELEWRVENEVPFPEARDEASLRRLSVAGVLVPVTVQVPAARRRRELAMA